MTALEWLFLGRQQNGSLSGPAYRKRSSLDAQHSPVEHYTPPVSLRSGGSSGGTITSLQLLRSRRSECGSRLHTHSRLFASLAVPRLSTSSGELKLTPIAEDRPPVCAVNP